MWSGCWGDLLDFLRQCDRRFGSHVREPTVNLKGKNCILCLLVGIVSMKR